MTSPTEPTPNEALTKEGDWITHDGGPNPVPGQMVEVLFKDGETWSGPSSNQTEKRWQHDLRIFLRFHIIAYRLATPSPAAQDGTATGLEVVGYRMRQMHHEIDGPITGWMYCERQPKMSDRNRWEIQALADYAEVGAKISKAEARADNAQMMLSATCETMNIQKARADTATRQLAERDADVQHLLSLIDRWEARALAAEADAARVRENTGAQAVIRDGKIEISIAVDALPLIVSGSCAARNLSGLWKVTDEADFAKEVCHALNAESENGTTRVHLMFDAAFDHVIEQGGEGIDEAGEEEFEAEAERLQALALTQRGA